MKYVVLIGDGMGDYPIDEFGGKTVLEAAHKPHMDELARGGLMGLAQTIPADKTPGSDVANMSIMGYNPSVYHSGRGPLEAASMGVRPAPNELTFRMNLVTVEFQGDNRVIMRDHAAGHITTEEAGELVMHLAAHLPLNEGQKLFPGVSYRHLLTWPDLKDGLETMPPHDHRNEDITWYFENDDPDFKKVLALTRASWPILADHPINAARRKAGRNPANSIWLWGQGKPPAMATFQERFGLSGAVISAVDLLKGLGVYAGLDPVDVPGATGLVDTNFEGKVAAALKALEKDDFAMIHVEAPDEAGHQGDAALKKKAVELFDERIVGPMKAGLDKLGEYRLLVLCDHYTPVSSMNHTREPVPFLIYPAVAPSGRPYTEAEAAKSGLFLPAGHTLIDLLLGRDR